jgi:hypothetical protein
MILTQLTYRIYFLSLVDFLKFKKKTITCKRLALTILKEKKL